MFHRRSEFCISSVTGYSGSSDCNALDDSWMGEDTDVYQLVLSRSTLRSVKYNAEDVMWSVLDFVLRRRRDPNAGNEVADIIDDLDKLLSVAQSNFEILKKNHSSTNQGNVGIGQPGTPLKSSNPSKTNSKEAHSTSDIRVTLSQKSNQPAKMNQPHEQHKPMETDASDNPPEECSDMTDEMDALNNLEESLKICLDMVKNYKRKRQNKRPSLRNKKVAIQLYCGQKTDLTYYAMQELQTKLKSQFDQHGMHLIMKIRTTPDSIESCEPLIVICLFSSRLGVDFINAVLGAPTGPNTAVLIFHHMKQHALPTIPSKTQLTEAEVKNVGIIIDVAFLEDMGLYDCAMNRNAYKTLITFIDGHCKK